MYQKSQTRICLLLLCEWHQASLMPSLIPTGQCDVAVMIHKETQHSWHSRAWYYKNVENIYRQMSSHKWANWLREERKKTPTNQGITFLESTVHRIEIMISVSFWTHNRKLYTCSSHVFPDEHEHIVIDVNYLRSFNVRLLTKSSQPWWMRQQLCGERWTYISILCDSRWSAAQLGRLPKPLPYSPSMSCLAKAVNFLTNSFCNWFCDLAMGRSFILKCLHASPVLTTLCILMSLLFLHLWLPSSVFGPLNTVLSVPLRFQSPEMPRPKTESPYKDVATDRPQVTQILVC